LVVGVWVGWSLGKKLGYEAGFAAGELKAVEDQLRWFDRRERE
jgi:hypothetical protein